MGPHASFARERKIRCRLFFFVVVFFCFFCFSFNNIYLVTTLLMTILTFTRRKNKNKVQEIKEKYLSLVYVPMNIT